jgi:hypothetical protein
MASIDKFILQNLENYNKQLNDKPVDLFTKYIELNNNYLMLCIENIQIQDENYKKYIIKKGGETIEHIFNFLLYYTLNPELTYHHCEQGFIYYIEFIGQMIINGDNTGLSLSSKDAVLFVFKKTIFDISKEYRETNPVNPDDDKKIKLVKNLTNTYKNLLFLYIDGLSFTNDKIIKDVDTKCIKNIVSNIMYFEIENNNSNNIEVINYFIDFIRTKEELSILNKLNVIELFSKKCIKLDMNIEKLQTNLQHDYVTNMLIDENYSYNNVLKLFSLLFN